VSRGFSLFSSVAERFTRNEQVGNSILPRGFEFEHWCLLGEVAKRSNALGSGPSPSGSRVRFSPSSHFCFRCGVLSGCCYLDSRFLPV
jgi:hypothetical protein